MAREATVASVGVSAGEIERRYRNIREAVQAKGLDALIVSGNQYSGFEGAVRYVSGFEIVHRYVHAVLPLEGEPTLVFPSEARWIGDKQKPWVREQVWADVPGEWLREHAQARGWKRVGVNGLNYIMPVRDYRALAQGSFELVPFEREFDLARAVKSAEELECIRKTMAIIIEGFWALLRGYRPGKTEAEIMAPAVELYFARGAGPRMMNIVLSGTGGEADAHFKVPGERVVGADDLMLYSLEIGGPEGYWVEFSRPVIRGALSPRTQRMKDVYPEAVEAARLKMKEGETAASIHRACSEVLARHGFGLGHLSGHSIGMTMIEQPAIGAKVETELRENMVFSFHPMVVEPERQVCLYTQDMYRVAKKEGENLADVPWRFYSGPEDLR
ncbi:MAG: M24 family metallopeptidase [Acidobacteria bacterium]|nr:M24 family metallopeptidase [Acidobacteriota bacterium]